MVGRSKNRMLAAVCLIAGIGVSIYGLTIVVSAMASGSWPTVPGTVVSSTVAQTSSGTGTSRSRGYRPEVEYTYSVDGRVYFAARISFNDEVAKTSGHAQEIADRYPVGKNVDVAYDPDNPNSATLETGVTVASFAVFGFGIVLLVAGVVFLFLKK